MDQERLLRVTNNYNQYVRNSRVKALAVSVQTECSSSFTDAGTFDLPNLPHWKDTSKPDSDCCALTWRAASGPSASA